MDQETEVGIIFLISRLILPNTIWGEHFRKIFIIGFNTSFMQWEYPCCL